MIAEAAKRTSLPTLEEIPVEIRVKIYNYILIADADTSLRSASEMEAQIDSSNVLPSLSIELWQGISKLASRVR